ncbi:MAG: RDD family protein [Pseudomonadota bacterium]
MTETAAPVQSASLEARTTRKRNLRKNPYASPGKRVVAYTVDHLFISLASIIFSVGLNFIFPAPPFEMMPPELQASYYTSGMPTDTFREIPTQEEAMQMIAAHWVSQMGNFKPLFLLSILLPLVYFSMFAASKWQATPGMRWCQIIITDKYGNGLNLLQATWRTTAHFLTVLTLGFGFWAIHFNKKRLTLHDWLSGTQVRKYDPNFEAERKRRTQAAKQDALTTSGRKLDSKPDTTGTTTVDSATAPKKPARTPAKRPQSRRQKKASKGAQETTSPLICTQRGAWLH